MDLELFPPDSSEEVAMGSDGSVNSAACISIACVTRDVQGLPQASHFCGEDSSLQLGCKRLRLARLKKDGCDH
ncbi:hypothetical protein PoB_006153200 [Plakobranchus ocellatus]|uniref:Uncharacterized protein n=1 Tax=Plakobranchus ocellatus TaxID=259542 RepID=A0AAV4CT25_9GAST|nr:hypothetical protein PoB_006153200 [Plakobranchus ocellatus]